VLVTHAREEISASVYLQPATSASVLKMSPAAALVSLDVTHCIRCVYIKIFKHCLLSKYIYTLPLCTALDPCSSGPCKHRGICSGTEDGDSFSRRCPPGFGGDRCQIVRNE
jgi:hypothetical protein